MKNEDLEKTQYMSPKDMVALKTGKKPKLSDTQELPALGDDLGIKPPFPQAGQAVGKVRELPPDGKKPKAEEQKKKFLTPKRKRAMMLGVGFAAALLIGFMIAGYNQDKSEAQHARQVQEQQMKDKEKQIAEQETDLKARRAELEKQKKELQERQRQLEEQSSRAKGRNEQMGDSAPSSTIGKIIDKVTGKEADRRQKVEQNKQQSAQSDTAAADVGKSIEDAQRMLDEVNSKLDSVESMKAEASQLKDKAAAAYEENKGVINQAIHYARVGAGLLEGWLSH